MNDIFISYASEDRAWASRLAEALEAHGWSVWWDLRIAPGEQFDRVIEKELYSARCVIVIWSESSVSSKWVRAEAEDGMKRDVLIPVLIEDVQIPLVFRQIQAAKLQDWHEGLSHPALEQLIASVSSKIGSEPVKKPVTEERAAKSPLRKWLKWTIPALLFTFLIGLALFQFLNKTKGREGREMVLIQGGTFMMGSTEEDVESAHALMKKYDPDAAMRDFEPEQPSHPVKIDTFYIDKYEVTHAEFKEYLQKQNRSAELSQLPTPPGENHPVTGVSWMQADSYCRWAGKELPTEAQWEMAARDRDRRIYPWGWEPPDGSRANFCGTKCEKESKDGSDGYTTTAPVGSYENGKSKSGVYNMAGNVREWVRDWYDAKVYTRANRSNPYNEKESEHRVVRGGSWASVPPSLRSAYRGFRRPDARDDKTGFRCATQSIN